MALLQIRALGDPVLRRRATRVRIIDDSVQRLIEDMLETLRHIGGAGLAAPQVGIPLRVIVIELPGEDAFALINPQLVKREGERVLVEGCLSIPGYQGEIKRSASVTVKGQDPQGKEVRIKADGLLAEALEHEIDHLNGVLYIDHVETPEKLHRIEPGVEEGL